MKHSMWLLNFTDSVTPVNTIPKLIAQVMAPAVKLGIDGTFYLRGFGQLTTVNGGPFPKCITDLANISPADRAALRRFTAPGFVWVAGKGLRIRRPKLCFYQWLSRSVPPATREQFLIAANIAEQMHGGSAYDDYPATTPGQREWIDARHGTGATVEPNWSVTDTWSHARPVICELNFYRAQPGAWIRRRTDAMPPRTLVYDFKPSGVRDTVLANCRELYRACVESNSDVAYNGEMVTHGISVAEIEKGNP